MTVEKCSQCRGLFLDRGELEELLEAEHRWSRGFEGGYSGGRRRRDSDPEDDHEVQTAIADALANLRHLATRRGLDFNDAIRVSARYETDDLAEDMGHQSGE